MKEQEYKFLLQPLEFERVQQLLQQKYPGQSKAGIQINYYYDTDNFMLTRNSTTLRIRQKGEALQGQLKIKTGKTAASPASELLPADHEEIAFDAGYVPLQITVANQIAVLQGVLVTQRTSFMLHPGLLVEFDHNSYLGVCDYEVEIEFTEANGEAAKNMAELFALNQQSGCGKAARFFIEKEKQKQKGPLRGISLPDYL